LDGRNGSNWLTEIFANRPFIVGALFLGTYFVPFLVLIGLALAYVFKRNPEEDWEESHFLYLIRTFWIAVLGLVAVAILSALGIWFWSLSSKSVDFGEFALGFVVPMVVTGVPLLAFCGVRIILSLMRSASHRPMPNPSSFLL